MRWPRNSAWPCRPPCCCRTRRIRRAPPISPCAIWYIRSNWDEIFEYIGFPAFLKPYDGGGWKSVYKVDSPDEFFAAYDETGDLCMTLQRGVKFQEYFRCYVVGQKKVHVMRYDPRQPHHLRYVPGNPPPDPALHERMVRRCADAVPRAGLRSEHRGVRGGRRRAVRHRFPESGAGRGARIRGAGKFRVDRGRAWPKWPWSARTGAAGAAAEMRWARFLAGACKWTADRVTRPSFTIGIEEEYQTIDPETRDLRSHIDAEIIAKGQDAAQRSGEAGDAPVGGRSRHRHLPQHSGGASGRSAISAAQIIDLARDNGLRLAAGGTHPFADWRKQEIYPDERYHTIVEDMKMVARANLIFGLHVHIGVEDRETAIQLMNAARYFLPHMLALSTNSPFWLGMDTGLKSYRCKVFDKFPRTNIPDYFPSWWRVSRDFVDLLVQTNCIDNAKKIWWDIRPHPHFPTLEFRICDMPMRAGRNHRDRGADPGDRGEAVQAARGRIRASGSTAAR